MIEKLEDYSAKVVVVSKESEVADAISTFLADQKATSVVVPTGPGRRLQEGRRPRRPHGPRGQP